MANADRIKLALDEAFYASEPTAYLRTRLAAALRIPATGDSEDSDDSGSLSSQVLARLPGWHIEDAVEVASPGVV